MVLSIAYCIEISFYKRRIGLVLDIIPSPQETLDNMSILEALEEAHRSLLEQMETSPELAQAVQVGILDNLRAHLLHSCLFLPLLKNIQCSTCKIKYDRNRFSRLSK